jgi:hypothetical protein
LCAAYKFAARAVQIDTNGDNPALAGVASVNAALSLEQAEDAAPAIASGDRASALALVAAYAETTAMRAGCNGTIPRCERRSMMSTQGMLR